MREPDDVPYAAPQHQLPLRLHPRVRRQERGGTPHRHLLRVGRFPHSIIGSGQDVMVEFVSFPAGPFLNTGFHFNVGNWPGHVETSGSRNGTCDWVFSSDTVERGQESTFLSLAHWYLPGTSCSYLIRGRPDEVVRMYFPSFRVRPTEDVHCIWELRVKQERDVWLYVDQLDFFLNDCSLELIEVFLPGRDRPEFTICEKGDTQDESKTTILKARDLVEDAIIIHFKSSAPGHSNFKLTWTELFELPRNSDGTVMTSKLMAPGDCEFVCPGQPACIQNDLVCNGVRNCPSNNSGAAQHDEAPEISFSRTGSKFNYVALGLGAAGGTVVAVAVIILVCRNCRKRPDDNTF